MPTLPDTRSDDPFLEDASNSARYPTIQLRNARPRHPPRGRAFLFSYSGRRSVPRAQRVSEPQLISSTNCMRESWFANMTSAHTVDDIVQLSSDEYIYPASQSATVNSGADPSWCDVDDDHSQRTSSAASEDSGDASEPEPDHVEPGEYNTEEDSFYSMDSADQEVHPFLLSMPVIPLIKLERKATVRKPDSGLLLQNYSFLSPRIRDLRTPARMSSRRYGRILARTGPLAINPDTTRVSDSALDFEVSKRLGSDLACVRSASEPLLSSVSPSDDEEEPLLETMDESPHSDVLLSMIDEVDSSPGLQSDAQESGIVGIPKPEETPLGHSKGRHQRSSLSVSVSFSSIVHAVADGCASLDHLLRKHKTKPKPPTKPRPEEHVPDPQNPHDPTSKWAARQGQIAIKVFVPSMDDIWMFRVPQDIDLADFTTRVVGKLGFSVSFSGSLWDEPKYYFRTDERFKSWVKGRIRFGRNLPIVAHVPPPLSLIRLSVDGDGCEVWFGV